MEPTSHLRLPFEPWPFKLEAPGPAWLLDATGEVQIRCLCGYLLGSPLLHSIDADGTVRASVMHEQTIGGWTDEQRACRWHQFVVLERWVDGAIPAGQRKQAPAKRARELARLGWAAALPRETLEGARE